MTGPAGPPPPDAAVRELLALYAEFDAETARISPVCRASGRCCDFEAWGHTLFASRLESDHLARESGLEGFDPSSPFCPYWRERRCTARGPRPLGCRAYFCDASKTDSMQDLHEAFLRRLKGIHDRHGRAWDYAPLLRQLAAAARGGG